MRRRHTDNLLVPVCVSAVAHRVRIDRMEPVFMILGQSAATLAIDGGLAVQDVPCARPREQLLKDGHVLEYLAAKPEAKKPSTSGPPR